MRTSAFILSLAAVASAFNIGRRQSPAPPTCANACLNTATNNVPTGSCSGTDLVCLCSSTPYVQGVINCLATDCADHQDVLTALQYSAGYCGVAGVNTVLPVTTPATQLPHTSTATGSSNGTASQTSSSSTTRSSTSSTSTSAPGGAMSQATLTGATLGALVLAAIGIAF